MMSILYRRGVCGVLVVAVFALGAYTPLTAPKVHAYGMATFETNPVLVGGVVDTGVNTLGSLTISNVLNGIAWAVAKAAIQSMTRSMVNWINSGFQGSPAFVTDLKANLLAVADHIAGNFISQIIQTDFICSPFRLQLAASLNTYYKATGSGGFFFMNRCTLTGIVNNTQNALSSFGGGGGGWSSWFAMVSNPQNNIYGSYLTSSIELGIRITNARGEQITMLGWGRGFLSWCGTGSSDTTGQTTNLGSDAEAGKALNSVGVAATKTADAQTCTNKDGSKGTVQTPGSVVESQLEEQLGTGVRQLEIADSINEIVGALAQQLMQQVLGATGLFGSSQPSSDGRSYTDQLGSATTTSESQSQSFVVSLQADEKQFSDYRTNLETVKTAATSAQTSLTQLAAQCSNQADAANAKLATDVVPVVTQETAAIDIAVSTISKLSALEATMHQSTSVDALANAAAQYQALKTDPTTPTGAQLGQAAADAIDTGDTPPQSLYTKMKTIDADAKASLPLCIDLAH